MVIREVLYKNNKELWTCPEQLSVNVIFIERLKILHAHLNIC